MCRLVRSSAASEGYKRQDLVSTFKIACEQRCCFSENDSEDIVVSLVLVFAKRRPNNQQKRTLQYLRLEQRRTNQTLLLTSCKEMEEMCRSEDNVL